MSTERIIGIPGVSSKTMRLRGGKQMAAYDLLEIGERRLKNIWVISNLDLFIVSNQEVDFVICENEIVAVFSKDRNLILYKKFAIDNLGSLIMAIFFSIFTLPIFLIGFVFMFSAKSSYNRHKQTIAAIEKYYSGIPKEPV